MKKILLIEDDADLYSLSKYNLEKEGFRWPDRRPARALWTCAAASIPDLVILDIMLPDSDGLEICKGIRAIPSWPIRR